jgi:hypothetical protein
MSGAPWTRRGSTETLAIADNSRWATTSRPRHKPIGTRCAGSGWAFCVRASSTEPTADAQRRTIREDSFDTSYGTVRSRARARRHSLLANPPRCCSDDHDDFDDAPSTPQHCDDKPAGRKQLRASLQPSRSERCALYRWLRGLTVTQGRSASSGSGRRSVPTRVDPGAGRHPGRASANVGQPGRRPAHEDLEQRRRRRVPSSRCRDGDPSHIHGLLQWRTDRQDSTSDTREDSSTDMPGGSGHRRSRAITGAAAVSRRTRP